MICRPAEYLKIWGTYKYDFYSRTNILQFIFEKMQIKKTTQNKTLQVCLIFDNSFWLCIKIPCGISSMSFSFPKLYKKLTQSEALEYSQATEGHIPWWSHTQSVHNTQYFNNLIGAAKSKVTPTIT